MKQIGLNQSQSSSQQFNGQRVPAQTFAAKFKSKKEIFNFLTIDGKAYLPPYETITIYHMRDIVSGEKKVSTRLAHSAHFILTNPII
jgi:hypothetical protein